MIFFLKVMSQFQLKYEFSAQEYKIEATMMPELTLQQKAKSILECHV